MTSDKISEEIRIITEEIEKTTKRMEEITCKPASPSSKMLRNVRTKLNVLLCVIIVLVLFLGVVLFYGDRMYKDWRNDQYKLHELTETIQRQNETFIELHKKYGFEIPDSLDL